jgi:hypothetical protein
MKDFALPATCPYCGKEHDFSSNTTDGCAPRDGDLSLCIGCGQFGIFEGLALGGIRRTTAQETAEIAVHPQACRVLNAWSTMQARRARKATS